MTVCLTMIVRDEAETLPKTLPSYMGLIDTWVILDTGSRDDTQDVARALLSSVPGTLIDIDWKDFADARTRALKAARGEADWLLMTDADMHATIHPGLRDWLETDPDPAVDAWQLEIVDSGTIWTRPLLLRGDQEWVYRQPVHEYLDTAGRYCRPLLGLTLRHERTDGAPREKYDGYAELLRPDAEKGEPRAVFYLAESLRFAGRHSEAVEWYAKRLGLNGFEEERWYSAYQIARLQDDVGGLLEVWESRPWRHEPLTAAARLVAAQGPDRDVLFLEPSP